MYLTAKVAAIMVKERLNELKKLPRISGLILFVGPPGLEPGTT